ncbi:MAG TPA: TonB family protein [Bryobacteraceae bacterium]|nr:TonB family protein [Bryobacteraceae bacterium]
MFDQTFVDTHAHARKPWTMALSLALQCGAVSILVIVPIVHPEVLHPKLDVPVWIPLKPLKEKPTPEVKTATVPARVAQPRAFTQPAKIPDKIAKAVEMEAAPEPQNFGMVGPPNAIGTGTAIAGIGQNLIPDTPPPSKPRPAPPKPAAPAGPVRVSTGVQSAKLLFAPKPQYPSLARTARAQGTVRIQAIIAMDGSIRNLQVISGPSLLVNAAVEAVKQWRYQPTLLNDRAVEVITEIDVVFTLGQ